MKKLMYIILIASSLVASSISPNEAINHIGEKKTVCGKVASTYYAMQSNGSPTFLNLGRAYPNQIFTAVIFEEYRSNFVSSPEDYYKYKNICVSGRIDEYRGVPQIVLRSKSQIK